MSFEHVEEDACRTFWAPASLLPIAQRGKANAEGLREEWLREADRLTKLCYIGLAELLRGCHARGRRPVAERSWCGAEEASPFHCEPGENNAIRGQLRAESASSGC